MAVSMTVTELASATGADTATATRLLPVVTEAVQEYAEAAPINISNEAAIRMAGWLFSHPSDGLNTNTIGDLTARFSGGSMLSPLRFSGAMALLSPYKERRAGAL